MGAKGSKKKGATAPEGDSGSGGGGGGGGGAAAAPAAEPAAPAAAGGRTNKDRPELAAYFKLLKIGVPTVQIKQKMVAEGRTQAEADLIE
jgi:hypothetical protein